MTIDLDELERKAKAAQTGPWSARRRSHKDDWVIDSDKMEAIAELRGPVTSAETLVQADAEHIAAANPSVVLALIERVRAAEIVGSEWMALQEAAGFPKDGMVRSVKDVSDSVVLMAERLREAETSQACEHGISGPRCFECPDGVTQHWAGVRELQERVRELDKRDREWQASTGLMHPETDG